MSIGSVNSHVITVLGYSSVSSGTGGVQGLKGRSEETESLLLFVCSVTTWACVETEQTTVGYVTTRHRRPFDMNTRDARSCALLSPPPGVKEGSQRHLFVGA